MNHRKKRGLKFFKHLFFVMSSKSLFNMKRNSFLCLPCAINFCVGICTILQVSTGDLGKRSRWQQLSYI